MNNIHCPSDRDFFYYKERAYNESLFWQTHFASPFTLSLIKVPTYARVYVSKREKKRNLNKIMKYLRNFPEVNFIGFILMKLTCK